MAEREQRLSRRDQIYLQSTSFEVYMGVGAVFVLIFTAGFIIGLKLHMAWLVWPGLLIAMVAGFVTLKWLERRELARKLAEVEANPCPDVTPQ